MRHLSAGERGGRTLAASLLVVAAWAAGCATSSPGPAIDSTARLLDGRLPRAVELRATDAAVERRRALLAAPLTADAAGEVALLSNPLLRARLEDLGIAQADLAQATRLANPRLGYIDLSGHGERLRTTSLLVEIVDWLVTPLRRRVAEGELERTKLLVGQAVLDTVADARKALYQYQAAQQLLSRLRQTEEIARASADYANALRAAGNLTAVERANIEAGWAEVKAERLRTEADVAARREDLLLAMGVDAREVWTAADALAGPEAPPSDGNALEELALRQRLDLSAARWGETAIERAISLRRATRFTPLGIEAGVERERETDGVHLTGPVVELRLPLFDTGKASLRRLEAARAQALWQRRSLEAQVRSDVRRSLTRMKTAAELVAAHEQSLLPLRLEVMNGTILEYNAMLIGTFDVLAARRLEIEAERSWVQSLVDYWIARVDLERVVGGPLAAAIVPAPAQQHDPSEHGS